MRDLAYVLSELQQLCRDPMGNLDEMCTLLQREHELAEFEVARFMVVKHLGDALDPMLRSVDQYQVEILVQ